MATFKAMPIYVKGTTGMKLVKEIETASVKFMTNGEQQIGFDEVMGESDGVVTTEGSFDTVMPVAGMQIDITLLCINQTPCEIGALIGGHQYRIPNAKITEAELNSTSKSGVQKGKFSFRGGKPQVI